MTTLEEVAQIFGGGTPSRTETSFFGGGICWATPTDVTALKDLYIERTKETVTETGLANSSAKLLPAGSVLLTSRATIGYTAIAKIPICTNQGFVNFVCGPDLQPEYLAYWLRFRKPMLERLANGATFKEISRGTVRKIKITLPDRVEQRRIVDLLSRAESIVRMRREAEAKAKEIIPALFLDMFGDPGTNPKGWDLRTVASVVRLINGRGFKESEWKKEGYPIIRIQNLRERSAPFNFYRGNFNPKHLTHKGALLIAWAGQLVSFGVHIWPGPEGLLNQHIFRVEPLVLTEPLFLKSVLADVVERAKAGFHGIEIKHITKRALDSAELIFPPIEIQRRFAAHCARAQVVVDQQSLATTQADRAFQSLQAGMFGGMMADASLGAERQESLARTDLKP